MMVTRNGGTYLVGVLSQTASQDKNDPTKRCRNGFYFNILHFSDWVKSIMKAEEEKHCLTHSWTENSHRPWLARQEDYCIRGKFNKYAFRDKQNITQCISIKRQTFVGQIR